MTEDITVGHWTCYIDWFIGSDKAHFRTKLILESKDWDENISANSFDKRDKAAMLHYVKKESEDNKRFSSYLGVVCICNLLVKRDLLK